ncbi:glycosyltransferase family 2 protein [Acidisoma sp.]|uniref:glycosyltransferase family 2 protein n=1 Tax=Acidisoma sp. TaxID=1872115 RepID=UPI003B00A4E3
MTLQTPVLSIIVPTFNRARFLLSTVEQILRQDFTDFELLVVDQSSPEQHAIVRDGLASHRSDRRLSYFHLPSSGVANARNAGLARVSGQFIMFLDDDVILLTSSFLRAHLDCYDDPRIGGVTGRTIERVNRENVRHTANRITVGGRTMVNLLGHERCQIHSLKGANMSVRSEAIAGMGGFDRNYTGTALLEEADFSERILKRGWQFVFEPTAELLHLSAPAGGVRVSDQAKADYFRFRSTAYFVRKHRGRLGLVPFAVTHLQVALKKAAQAKRVGLMPELLKGAMSGLQRLQLGTDQEISYLSKSAGTDIPASLDHHPSLN